MNGLNDAYVESAIKKAMSGKRVAVFDDKLWGLAEAGERQAEPRPKKTGRPKFISGPNHPWRRYVLKAKKG